MKNEESSTRKQRRTVGAIVRIPLGDGWHSYGQILNEADFAFFDVRTREDLDVEDIVNRSILFRVAVMNHAVTSGRWRKIGTAPVTDTLARPQPKFIQDALDPSQFQIYVGGEIRSAARHECEGLERVAVWEPEHVEDRLRDHFAGRPNKWVESLRIRNT